MTMELESVKQEQYKTLEERSQPELQSLAKLLDLKLPTNLGVTKLAQAIRVKQTMNWSIAEELAQAAKIKASGKPGHKPSFEEVLIFGGEFKGKTYEPSPKKIYKFINNLDPKQEFSCVKGGKQFFHLYPCDKEGAALMNVMPECLCTKYPKLPSDATVEEQNELELLKAISLAEIGFPVWENRPDPQYKDRMRPTIVSWTKRFSFIEVGPAPENAPFGVYFSEQE